VGLGGWASPISFKYVKCQLLAMSDDKRGMGFVDFDNINITARNHHNLRFIDFNKFRAVMLEGLSCVGCTVYLPYKMQNLLKVIQRSGLKVEVVSPGKSVDGRLIFDLLTNTYNDKFDTAVIASGDKDYVHVIEEVKRKKKEVRIASFSSSLAHALKSVANDVIDLDKRVADISLQMYPYTCSNCGNKFELPFKLFANKQPLCKNCLTPSGSP
jgi:uncharacterized protein (TIGR00288 family)